VWGDLIFSFVKGNLNLSKQKAFSSTTLGGLGLFEVADFLDAQKCSWVLRSRADPTDNWKLFLGSEMLTADTIFRKKINLKDEVLLGIVTAYKKFYKAFLGISNNFKKAPIVDNEFFTTTTRSEITLKKSDLANFGPESRRWLESVTISKLTANGGMVPKAELDAKVNTVTTREFYAKLTGIFRTAHLRYSTDDGSLGLMVSQSFRTWKKGSRRFRNVLCKNNKLYVPHNLVKFASNTETIINFECAKILNNMWNLKIFSNAKRTFLFKLFNNILPYNTILSHFVRGKSRNCTICDILGNQDINDETVLHLFYDCIPVNNLLNEFFPAVTNQEIRGISRHEIFCCFKRTTDDKNYLHGIAAKFFIYYIWECKLRQ
jgi:hypothetical protein